MVGPDVDLRSYDYMPLKVQQLRDSELATIAEPQEFMAAVLLWCASWHQVPAASLPNDDRQLCKLSGLGRDLITWGKVREVALRHFELCSDGRLYHPLIADLANVAWEQKKRDAARTVNATLARQRRRAERDEKPAASSADRDVQRGEASTSTKGTETEDNSKGNNIPTVSSELPRRDETTTDWAVLEARMRAAAGWQSETAPALAIVGPVVALIESGASLELDVLPTIRAKAAKSRFKNSWKFFLDDIKEARDLRLSMAAPSARAADQKPANGAMTEAEATAFLANHAAKFKSGVQP